VKVPNVELEANPVMNKTAICVSFKIFKKDMRNKFKQSMWEKNVQP